MVGDIRWEAAAWCACAAAIFIRLARFTSPRCGRAERSCLMESDDENDDEGFIQTMELAIDWHLDITEEQWERYLALVGRKGGE